MKDQATGVRGIPPPPRAIGAMTGGNALSFTERTLGWIMLMPKTERPKRQRPSPPENPNDKYRKVTHWRGCPDIVHAAQEAMRMHGFGPDVTSWALSQVGRNGTGVLKDNPQRTGQAIARLFVEMGRSVNERCEEDALGVKVCANLVDLGLSAYKIGILLNTPVLVGHLREVHRVYASLQPHATSEGGYNRIQFCRIGGGQGCVAVRWPKEPSNDFRVRPVTLNHQIMENMITAHFVHAGIAIAPSSIGMVQMRNGAMLLTQIFAQMQGDGRAYIAQQQRLFGASFDDAVVEFLRLVAKRLEKVPHIAHMDCSAGNVLWGGGDTVWMYDIDPGYVWECIGEKGMWKQGLVVCAASIASYTGSDIPTLASRVRMWSESLPDLKEGIDRHELRSLYVQAYGGSSYGALVAHLQDNHT